MDNEVREMAEAYLARQPNSRAAKAIRLILQNGFATTRDLEMLGYKHPPRAIGDVKDVGIPIKKELVADQGGRRMASYRFGSAADIRKGQTGRTNFSKSFKTKLIDVYGQRDAVTMAEHPANVLQIDHRIPYRVAGDEGLKTNDVTAFMLLDAKSQRAKSWSCEQCENFQTICDANICRRCFWAFPENYDHVAMRQERRADVIWQGAETIEHQRLADLAAGEGMTVPELLKRLGSEKVERSRNV